MSWDRRCLLGFGLHPTDLVVCRGQQQPVFDVRRELPAFQAIIPSAAKLRTNDSRLLETSRYGRQLSFAGLLPIADLESFISHQMIRSRFPFIRGSRPAGAGSCMPQSSSLGELSSGDCFTVSPFHRTELVRASSDSLALRGPIP